MNSFDKMYILSYTNKANVHVKLNGPILEDVTCSCSWVCPFAFRDKHVLDGVQATNESKWTIQKFCFMIISYTHNNFFLINAQVWECIQS